MTEPLRPLALVALLPTGIVASALLGATTNAVNGAVSPTYFVNILRWHDVEHVWRAAVAQGVFEGLVFGVLFSLVFTTGVGIVTRAACPFVLAVRHLAGVVGGALVGWVLGGLAAMGLALLSPEFYRASFLGVPDTTAEMLRYAWVGGSIWGLELGGFASVVVALVLLRGTWQRRDAS